MADIIPLVKHKRPLRDPPEKPCEVVKMPRKPDPEPYPNAHLGEGWPPPDMLPPSDVE